MPFPSGTRSSSANAARTSTSYTNASTLTLSNPSAVPAGTCTVLSADELSRMRALTNRTGINSAPNSDQERKADLKKRSDERVATWSNTLEALRTRKEEDRRHRADVEEEARRVVDAEEAAFQLARKQEMLDRARKIAQESKPQYREFRSDVVLAEVLHERRQQAEMVRIRRELGDRAEAAWTEQMRAEEERKAEEEREKLEEKKKLLAEVYETQRTQMEEMRRRRDGDRERARRDGEEMAERVRQVMEDEKSRIRQRKQNQIDYNKQLEKDIQLLKEAKSKMEEREKQSDLQARTFQEKKDAEMESRKNTLRKQLDEHLQRRQVVIDQKLEILQRIRNVEEERLHRDLALAEQRHQENEQQHMALQRRMKDSIRRNNDMQRSLRDQNKKLNLQMKEEYGKQARLANEILAQEERLERQRRFEEAQELMRYQFKQADEKHLAKMEDRELALVEAQLSKLELESEDAEFAEYVKRTVEKLKSEGKDVRAIVVGQNRRNIRDQGRRPQHSDDLDG